MTVCERLFRDLKFELPSTALKRFVVHHRLASAPGEALAELRAESVKEEHEVLREVVREFARRFEEAHGLKLTFAPEAEERLLTLALEEGTPVRELCAIRFKDYQFGLRLIAQNTGQKEFVISADAVAEPDRVLSDWVVKSYRSASRPESEGGGVVP